LLQYRDEETSGLAGLDPGKTGDGRRGLAFTMKRKPKKWAVLTGMEDELAIKLRLSRREMDEDPDNFDKHLERLRKMTDDLCALYEAIRRAEGR